MFGLPLLSSLSFLLRHGPRVSRHLPHAQPCACVCASLCLCAAACVCASCYVCTQGKTAESNCTGPSANSGKQTCILQTRTKKKQRHRPAHTEYAPQVPPLKPSTWTLSSLHSLSLSLSGSCVGTIDWCGLQYGPYCFRTKASALKAKVTS